jgi:hypothetical protein
MSSERLFVKILAAKDLRVDESVAKGNGKKFFFTKKIYINFF